MIFFWSINQNTVFIFSMFVAIQLQFHSTRWVIVLAQENFRIFNSFIYSNFIYGNIFPPNLISCNNFNQTNMFYHSLLVKKVSNRLTIFQFRNDENIQNICIYSLSIIDFILSQSIKYISTLKLFITYDLNIYVYFKCWNYYYYWYIIISDLYLYLENRLLTGWKTNFFLFYIYRDHIMN